MLSANHLSRGFLFLVYFSLVLVSYLVFHSFIVSNVCCLLFLKPEVASVSSEVTSDKQQARQHVIVSRL